MAYPRHACDVLQWRRHGPRPNFDHPRGCLFGHCSLGNGQSHRTMKTAVQRPWFVAPFRLRHLPHIAPDRKEQCHQQNLNSSQKPPASARHSYALKSWGRTPSSSARNCFAMQASPAGPASATFDRAPVSPAPYSLANTGLTPTPSICGATPSKTARSSIRWESRAT